MSRTQSEALCDLRVLSAGDSCLFENCELHSPQNNPHACFPHHPTPAHPITHKHRGRPGAVPDPPPPPLGAKMSERPPTIVQANTEKLAGAAGAGKFLCPVERGWENRSPHVFILKMLSFFWAFSLAPRKAGFVQPLLILWPYRSFPTMGTNGDKCCLSLIEDPTIEAQPRHEAVVGVGRNLSPGHNTVGPSACFAKDLRAL